MRLFNRKNKEKAETVQTAVSSIYSTGLAGLGSTGQTAAERQLFRRLREEVPVVDAAINKLVRLLGTFTVECDDPSAGEELNEFLENVRVNGCDRGIDCFLGIYADQLMMYGTAVGEIVMDRSGREIAALYNASLEDVELKADKNPLDVRILSVSETGERIPVPYPALVLCSTLMKEPGKVYGTSLLRGLPFVGDVLMKIFRSVGVNWDRVGNVRFAVNYKPGENDRSFTKQRAEMIASEWSKAMHSSDPRDFVTVGDVNIRVIGAEHQVPDCQIPARLLTEQLLSKLSIPPFLLGFSWSSTERMSTQQVDILTSELEYYRSRLEGAVRRICELWLRLNDHCTGFTLRWNNINLQDEVELARARLFNAQAESMEESTSQE